MRCPLWGKLVIARVRPAEGGPLQRPRVSGSLARKVGRVPSAVDRAHPSTARPRRRRYTHTPQELFLSVGSLHPSLSPKARKLAVSHSQRPYTNTSKSGPLGRLFSVCTTCVCTCTTSSHLTPLLASSLVHVHIVPSPLGFIHYCLYHIDHLSPDSRAVIDKNTEANCTRLCVDRRLTLSLDGHDVDSA